MHLWRAGEEAKVEEYLETRGLKRNALFAQLLQALIELAPAASEERSILRIALQSHRVTWRHLCAATDGDGGLRPMHRNIAFVIEI